MKSFGLFLLAIIALFIFLINLGPLILLGVSVFLLYMTFKQFMKAESTGAKVVWIILGLIILSMTISNIYALIGVLAIYFLYTIFRGDKDEKEAPTASSTSGGNNDPFTNFERQWAEMNK